MTDLQLVEHVELRVDCITQYINELNKSNFKNKFDDYSVFYTYDIHEEQFVFGLLCAIKTDITDAVLLVILDSFTL